MDGMIRRPGRSQHSDAVKQHIENFSSNKNLLVNISGGYDQNAASREQLINSLISALNSLNAKVNALEAELTSLREGSQ
ncbi:hypothetical protein R84981_002805 [Carnimonas sp. R-84981]